MRELEAPSHAAVACVVFELHPCSSCKCGVKAVLYGILAIVRVFFSLASHVILSVHVLFRFQTLLTAAVPVGDHKQNNRSTNNMDYSRQSRTSANPAGSRHGTA